MSRCVGRAFVLAVCGALLLGGCATKPPPPPPGPVHDALPEVFELDYMSSAFFGGYSSLELEKNRLVRRTYEPDRNGYNVLAKTEYFTPTEEQWRAFWREAERQRMWSWRKRYDPSDIGAEVFEGRGWKLVLAYRGRRVETSGENAGPVPGNPAKTTVGEKWNKPLDRAIGILTKEGDGG